MPCRVAIRLRNGRTLTRQMRDYPGFFTQPMSWDLAFAKFERLAAAATTASERRAIADAIFDLENRRVSELMLLLAGVHVQQEYAGGKCA
jgi:2-methylcitrate dehydratase